MNVSRYQDSFGSILPDIFSQIVAGTRDKEYSLKTGHIRVILVKPDSNQYAPTIRSSGSLNISHEASKVIHFFDEVDLSHFFSISEKIKKDLLNSVFRQIINGQRSKCHPLGATKKMTITFNRGVGRCSYHAENLSGDEEAPLVEMVCALVETKGIFCYFDTTSAPFGATTKI